MTEEDLKKLSSHSARVFALVLLSEAICKPDFMKSRLRWMGNSYRSYLRDNAEIDKQHNKALTKMSTEVIALLGNNLAAVPDTVPEDTKMGRYNEHD